MRQLSLLGLLAVSMGLLTGCPIYDDDAPPPVCSGSECGSSTGTGTVPGGCTEQAQCTGVNETCGSDGVCHRPEDEHFQPHAPSVPLMMRSLGNAQRRPIE